MKTGIDLEKFIQLNGLYLRQRYAEESDIDIISRWERGESVIALSHEFHRSPSSIYRLRERVGKFLANPPYEKDDIYMHLLHDIWVDVPFPLLQCSIACSDEDAYMLFRMSIGLYLTGNDCYFPRWFLGKISSSLGRKRYAVQTMKHMKELSIDTGMLFRFHIYDHLQYDKGIYFKFSKITEGILDTYPSGLLIRTIEEIDNSVN